MTYGELKYNAAQLTQEELSSMTARQLESVAILLSPETIPVFQTLNAVSLVKDEIIGHVVHLQREYNIAYDELQADKSLGLL